MISVFKTTISTKEKAKYATPTIDNITEIHHWNFDIEECDHILRIESQNSIILVPYKFGMIFYISNSTFEI